MVKKRLSGKNGCGGRFVGISDMLCGERLEGGRFVTGKNVRRDVFEPDVWKSAALPEVVRDDGWVPAGITTLAAAPGKMAVWFSRGNVLGYAVTGTVNVPDIACKVTTLGILKGGLVHVSDLNDGVVRIMVKGGRAVYATYDLQGIMTFCGEMPQLPWLHFLRAKEMNLSVGIGTVALSGKSDPRGNALSEDDVAIVSRAVKGAYKKLKAYANGTGMFLQPVIARYRLLDGTGSTVVVSPPVMVGASGGVQCTGEFTLASTDSLATVSAGNLHGAAFSLHIAGLEEIMAPWNRVVKRLVVELSPETDIVDEDGECMSRVSNDGREVTVSVTLPVGSEESRRRNVLGLLADPEKFGEHLIVENPFGYGCAAEVAVPVFPSAKRLTEPFGLRRHPVRDAVSFNYVADAGGWAVACGERQEQFGGYPPVCFSTVYGSGIWRALAEVDVVRADGSVQHYVSVCSGDNNVPLEFSPMIMFPDPNARKLTLSLESGGKTISETYHMQSLPDAGCACFLSEGFKGVSPRGELASLPSYGGDIPGVEERAGYVGIFDGPAMGRELDSILIETGAVAAASPAPRNGGSWDFSRVRLLLFGGNGTSVATIDKDGRFHSVAPMDSRPVRDASAVCRASGSKGLTHFVVAGGDLIEVSRSGVATLLSHCFAKRVGWCGRWNELWLSGGGKAPRRIDPRRPMEVIEVCGATVGMSPCFRQWCGRQLIVSDTGHVCDVENENDSVVDVALALRYDMGGIGGKPYVNLLADVFAARYHGSVGIYGDNGTALPELLCSYRVDGELNMPSSMRMAVPRRRFLELHVAGEAAGMAVRN